MIAFDENCRFVSFGKVHLFTRSFTLKGFSCISGFPFNSSTFHNYDGNFQGLFTFDRYSIAFPDISLVFLVTRTFHSFLAPQEFFIVSHIFQVFSTFPIFLEFLHFSIFIEFFTFFDFYFIFFISAHCLENIYKRIVHLHKKRKFFSCFALILTQNRILCFSSEF